jgi:hypothetical protein
MVRGPWWLKHVLVLIAWLATRALLVALATTRGAPDYHGDIGIYQHWYNCCLMHGRFPVADPKWQYPPGAAVVFWLPGVFPGAYIRNFIVLALVCDLVALVLLARRSTWAAWYWVVGVPLLGVLAVARFDIVPVVLCVAALCAARSPGVRGGLIGAGTVIKLWPAVLLAGTPPGQWRRSLISAVAVAGVVCVALFGGVHSFLGHQNARGVEVEAVAATPFLIWREFGWHAKIKLEFGAQQLNGPHIGLAQDASLAAMVLAVVAVVAWRLWIRAGHATWQPEFAADAPLAATLLFLVTNSVLSPQYLLWPLGIAAACLAAPRTTQRPVAILVLAAAALTQWIYPWEFEPVLHGSGVLTTVLVARNLLLVAATVLSLRRIYQASLRSAAVTEADTGKLLATPKSA